MNSDNGIMSLPSGTMIPFSNRTPHLIYDWAVYMQFISMY